MLTVEKTGNILNHFNIGFTEKAVVGYLQRGLLQKVSRIETGYYSRNTKYGYSIDKGSLLTFLLNRGIKEEEINSALPA